MPFLFSVAQRTWRALETAPKIGKEARFLLDCRRNIRGLDLLIVAGSHQLNDFGGIEMTAMGIMIIALIGLGLYPQPVLDLVQPVIDSLSNVVPLHEGGLK